MIRDPAKGMKMRGKLTLSNNVIQESRAVFMNSSSFSQGQTPTLRNEL